MGQPDLDCFERALESIGNYNEYCKSSASVYSMADAFWQCYDIIRSDVSICDRSELEIAITVLVTAESFIGERSIDYSLVSTYLVENLVNVVRDKEKDACSLLSMCKSFLEIDESPTATLSKLLEKLYLVMIMAILQNIVGNDIYSMINRCIVYDHLGNQAHKNSEFTTLLTRATNRVTIPTFHSDKKLDIYLTLGTINYRLNMYDDALNLLQKYVEGLIAENNTDGLDKDAQNDIALILIRLAYCFEKKNDSESINNAICILEAIRQDNPIKVFNTDKYESPLYGSERGNGSKCVIDYNVCQQRIKMEIHHALAHFYNERAVFHFDSKEDTSSDVRTARDYISLAKSMDEEDSLHSCHGLMCFEYDDYGRALEIYDEALSISNVTNNKALYNELLFYKAQVISSSQGIDQAKVYWDEYEEFCSASNNEDAMAQYYIIRTKAKLADSQLYSTELSVYRTMLEELSRYKPSLYVPKSVHDEEVRIILSLNTFFALRSIIENKISWVDGIEEAFFNLDTYYRLTPNKKYSINNFVLDDSWSKPTKGNSADDDTVSTTEYRTITEDEVFIIGYKGLHIACFGDYHNLMKSSYHADKIMRLKVADEFRIIQQILSNDYVDVIILAPTENLKENAKRITILKEIINSGVCTVAINSTAADIAQSVNTKGQRGSPIYSAGDKDEAIQMAVCLAIYELMRRNLISPTPMLGLAPLTESKSYSFQAGERSKCLLMPPSFDTVDIRQRENLRKIVDKIDRIHIEDHQNYQFPERSEGVLEECMRLLNARNDVLLVAFFDKNATKYPPLHAISYVMLDERITECIEYVCPAKEAKQYNLISIYKTVDGYDDIDEFIENSRINGGLCNTGECAGLQCNSVYAGLKDGTDQSNSMLKLLRNIFSILTIKNNVQSICTHVKHGSSMGILLVITKYLDAEAIELRQICQIVNRHKPDSFVDGLKTPEVTCCSEVAEQPTSPIKKNVEIEEDSVFWITLSDLKNEISVSVKKALSDSENVNDSTVSRKKAAIVAESMQETILSINSVLAERFKSPAIVKKQFFDNLQEIIAGKIWNVYLERLVETNIVEILKYSTIMA